MKALTAKAIIRARDGLMPMDWAASSLPRCGALRDAGFDLPIAVNVSGDLFIKDSFRDDVVEMLGNNGIDGDRFETEGFGPDQPIDTNDTKAGRAKNRRIEFSLIE